MINKAFVALLSTPENQRARAFQAAGNKIGTSAANVEKDFWLCFTLDALFNGRPKDGARLLFKGGTSLSKQYLINRFSEDVDITVFRSDLGHPIQNSDLVALPSNKKRQQALEAIKAACKTYITGQMRNDLIAIARQVETEANLAAGSIRIDIDTDDADGQTLFLKYPVLTTDGTDYIRSEVKIESGAKSQVDPHRSLSVQPYVSSVMKIDLSVPNVTTIDPERTLWDKLVIVHGQSSYFANRGEMRQGGKRVSRHYYDLFMLARSDVAERALANLELAADCQRHAKLFFNSSTLDLDLAVPGTFRIVPNEDMIDILNADYREMKSMIFGTPPSFDDIIGELRTLEASVNDTPTPRFPA